MIRHYMERGGWDTSGAIRVTRRSSHGGRWRTDSVARCGRMWVLCTYYRNSAPAAQRFGAFYSFNSVTLILIRLAGVMWNVFMASATADFSSGASTIPMGLPR